MKTISCIIFIFISLSNFGQVNNALLENSIAEEKKLDSSINKIYTENFLVQTDTRTRKIYLNSGYTLEKTLDYTITNVSNNKKVLFHQIPFSKTNNLENDSIILNDYNFDSYLDLYIQYDSKMWGGYFVYNPKKDIFIFEKLLNTMDEITIDWTNKTISGKKTFYGKYKDKYGTFRQTNILYYSEYFFEGERLENVCVKSYRLRENKKRRFVSKKKYTYTDNGFLLAKR